MTIRSTHAAMCLSLALAASVPVMAQVERSGASPTQKLMQQYQQVSAEKTALQAQVTQLKADLDGRQAELAQLKKERDALKSRSGDSAIAAAQLIKQTAAKETAERNLEQYKQRMTELVGRFRDTATNLKEVEADRNQLKKDLGDRNNAYDRCAEDNLQLYELTGQVLDRYDHVGLFTKASATEPFTRITRTRIDNLVTEYRERAEQLRAQKRAP